MASIATVNNGIKIDQSITHKSTTASTSTETALGASGEQHDDYTYSGNVTATDYYSVSLFT